MFAGLGWISRVLGIRSNGSQREAIRTMEKHDGKKAKQNAMVSGKIGLPVDESGQVNFYPLVPLGRIFA